MKDDETVALGLYSPELIDKVTQQVTKEAIRSDYLCDQVHRDECGNSSGLSVARVESSVGIDELKAIIVEIAAKSGAGGAKREAVGYATIGVSWLHSRDMSVLDDGMVSFTHHAVVRSSHSRAAIKKFRDEMIQELNRAVVTWI